MTTLLQEESLFSLELVVDKLTIPNVGCRFPAVAFRLLDFPNLIIYHVEPELGEKIKVKIKTDPYYKLGNQIPELLDKDGNYSIQKGKSCLLKISPDMMLSHLSSTPLYVMIIDTFPEVPKLIGNCTVPLDAVMDNLYSDICQNGLSIPSVRGEKGFYKIYNLMGVQIGGLSLGLRLLSLGIGLIPHLPAAPVSKLQKQMKEADLVTLPSKPEKDVIQEKVAKIVLEEAKLPIQKESVPLKKLQNFFPAETQTLQDLTSVAVQTDKKRRAKIEKQASNLISSLSDDLEDVVVTNIVCPPPLFFNSEKDKCPYNLLFGGNSTNISHEESLSDESFSDNDTIRLEDWNSDAGDLVEHKRMESRTEPVKKRVSHQKQPIRKENQKDFPLLNALMEEISALQTGKEKPRLSQSQIFIAKPSSSKSRHRSPSPTTSIRGPSYSRSPSPGRERESVEKFINRMSSSFHTEKEIPSARTPRKVLPEPKKPLKLHKCQEAAKPVPKSKSWLRKVPPPIGVKKTKFESGLTNTQRLRLEKTNPELLKTLEKQEKERKDRWREQRRLIEEQRMAEGTLGYSNTILYGMDGHKLSDKASKTHVLESHYNKKPKPTPRIHVHANNGYHDVYDEDRDYDSEDYQMPSPRRYVPQEKPTIENVPTLEKDTLTESAQVNESTLDYERIPVDTNDSMLRASDEDILPSPKYPGPGFPSGDYTDEYEAQPQDELNDYYSEKYQNEMHSNEQDVKPTVKSVDAGAELGLRMIVDKYSDESENSFKSAMSELSEASQTAVSRNSFAVKGPTVSVAVPAMNQQKNVLSKNGQNQIEASVDSTAYISRSQVLSQQSYESDISEEPRAKRDFRPTPSPRHRRNTESVSSYNGDENASPRSPTPGYHDYESESFEDESDQYVVQAKGINEAKVSSEAKLGYTWGY